METSYKFKIYPDEEQKEYLNNNFRCVCFVYNYFLKRRTETYEDEHKNLGLGACCRELTKLKHSEPYKFLIEADSTGLQQAVVDLDNDFQMFFKKKTKRHYPKYKKNIDVNSYRIEKKVEDKTGNTNIYFEDGYLRIPKISKIRLAENEVVPENLIFNYATISRNENNEYFVTLT